MLTIRGRFVICGSGFADFFDGVLGYSDGL
jgi:hypothetical protein